MSGNNQISTNVTCLSIFTVKGRLNFNLRLCLICTGTAYKQLNYLLLSKNEME
jgi:hypothetical protein